MRLNDSAGKMGSQALRRAVCAAAGLVLAASAGANGEASDPAIPVEEMAPAGFAEFADGGRWRVPAPWGVKNDADSAEGERMLRRPAVPDKRVAAHCTLTLDRGRREMVPRRYLIRVECKPLSEKTRGLLEVSCAGQRVRSRSPFGSKWHTVEAVVDTAAYFPGRETSSCTVSLDGIGAGGILFRNPRLFAVPVYGVHVRYTVLKPRSGRYEAGALIIRRHRNTNHEDAVRHRYHSRVGPWNPAAGTPAGTASEWFDLRRYLFGTGRATASFRIRPAGDEDAPAKPVTVRFEFASHRAPFPPESDASTAADEPGLLAEEADLGMDLDLEDEKAPQANPHIVVSESLTSGNGNFAFYLPENHTTPARFVDTIQPVADDLENRRTWVKNSLPAIESKRFSIPIGANFFDVGSLGDRSLVHGELELLARIGIRGIARGAKAHPFDAVRNELYGNETFRDRTYASRISPEQVISPYDGDRLRTALERKYEALAKAFRGTPGEQHIAVMELMDEPPNFGLVAADLPAFRAFVKKRVDNPAEIGFRDWEDVLPFGMSAADLAPQQNAWQDIEPAMDLEADADPAAQVALDEPEAPAQPDARDGDESVARASDLPSRRLKYYTHRFRARKTCDFFRTATEVIEPLFPGVRTSVNFRAGLRAVLTSQTADWFLLGRERAVTHLWNEDWLNTYGWRHNGVELVSYYVELMRTAARKHDLPVGGFLMAYWGQAERKAYAALAHGSRHLHFWRYGPAYANYLPYSWSHSQETVAQIGAVCRDVARVEDSLVGARRARSRVALLCAKTDPLWGRSQAENRLLFLALMHDQIPADILTEYQIERENLLQEYDYLYVTSQSVRRDTLRRIAEWVGNGGRLWLSGGAAARDEFDEPTPALRARLKLAAASPVAENQAIVVPKGAPDAVVDTFFPLPAATEHRTTLRFRDGTPAQVRGTCGQGTFCATAFRAGELYENNVRRNFNRSAGKGRIQSGWRSERRRWITDFARNDPAVRPVLVDRPAVEAVLYRTPEREILMLVDFTGTEQDEPLEIGVRSRLETVKSVESLRRGDVAFSRDDDWLRFHLPLGRADTVILR